MYAKKIDIAVCRDKKKACASEVYMVDFEYFGCCKVVVDNHAYTP